jgi:hypothetical protein
MIFSTYLPDRSLDGYLLVCLLSGWGKSNLAERLAQLLLEESSVKQLTGKKDTPTVQQISSAPESFCRCT